MISEHMGTEFARLPGRNRMGDPIEPSASTFSSLGVELHRVDRPLSPAGAGTPPPTSRERDDPRSMSPVYIAEVDGVMREGDLVAEKQVISGAEHYLARLELVMGGDNPSQAYFYELKHLRDVAMRLSPSGMSELLGKLEPVLTISTLYETWGKAKGKLMYMVAEQNTYPSMPEQGEYFAFPGVDMAMRAYMRSGEIIKNVAVDNGAKIEDFHATTLWAEAQQEGDSSSALRRAVIYETMLRMAVEIGRLSFENGGKVDEVVDNIWDWKLKDVGSKDDLREMQKGEARTERVLVKLDERALRIEKELSNIVDTFRVSNKDKADELETLASSAELKARKLGTLWGEFNLYDPALRTGSNELSDFMHFGFWQRKRRGSQGAGPLMTNGLLFGWEPTKTTVGRDKTLLEPIVNTGFYAAGDGVGSFSSFTRNDAGKSLKELIKLGEEIDWGRFNKESMKSWATLIRVQKGLQEDAGFVDSKFVKITAKLEEASTEKWMESVGYMGALLMILSPVTGAMRAYSDRDIREGKLLAGSPLKSLKDDEAEKSRYRFGARGEVYDNATGNFWDNGNGEWIVPGDSPNIDRFKSGPRYKLAQDGKIWDVVQSKYLDRNMITWVRGRISDPDKLKTYNQIKHAFRMATFIALVARDLELLFHKDHKILAKKVTDSMTSLTSTSARTMVGIESAFIDENEGYTGGIPSDLWKGLDKGSRVA